MTEVKTKYKKLVCKDGYKFRKFFQPMRIGINPKEIDWNYTITEIGDVELHNALMDFINISQEIDNGSDPEEIIFAFLNQWGSLHNMETTDFPKLLTYNPVFPNQSELMNVEDWFARSNFSREILVNHKKNRKKIARDQFLKRDWFSSEIFFEDDPELTPYIEPKNLEEALHWTLRFALRDKRPLRACPVCGKLFQRKITAKQCSKKCGGNKWARKDRSKK